MLSLESRWSRVGRCCIAATLITSVGCAREATTLYPATVPQRPLPVPQTPYEVGLASYYHDSLAGNRTANGDIYDPSAPTAAHKTLPLGTIVDVVRRNGRAVRVRINDRGPFVTGRVLDLSRGAATALDMIREGVVEVALFIVAWPPPKARKR
jgi:rare lipoprotein A (peptidoglycan hydrolase)